MDGDQVTVKAVYSTEANAELESYINSKPHYIAINGINNRMSSNEAVQSIYNLTKVESNVILTEPKFKK